MRIIVADICNTLYDSNTTFDFVKYVVLKDVFWMKTVYSILFSHYLPFYYLIVIISNVSKIDIAKLILLKFLFGMKKNYLEDIAETFVVDYLFSKKVEKTHEIIHMKCNASHKVILISASIELIVKAIAKKLDCDYISSKLKYDRDDNCLGVLKKDITGKKDIELKKILFGKNEKLTVLTDNKSDYKLAKMANERYIVLNKKKDIAFWSGLDPIFIDNVK